MRKTTYLCAAMLLGVAPIVSAATDTTGCYVVTSAASLAAGGYYVRGTLGEIWEETNGISGLQRRDSGCADGRVLQSDTCWFMGPDGLTRCSTQTAASQV